MYPMKPSRFVFLASISLVLAGLACQTVVEPVATQPPGPPPESTEPQSAAPTDLPAAQPTEAPIAPVATPLPPTVPDEPEELAILSFTVDAEDVAVGKRLTFHWQTTGAVRAIIWSGTSHRFPQAWEVELRTLRHHNGRRYLRA